MVPRILVIGSVRDFPGGIENWLLAHGTEPCCCDDVRAARVAASAEDFVLVMVDAAEIEDVGVFAELRACGQPGTFVSLGRGSDIGEEVRALGSGADIFVSRPLRPEQLDIAISCAQPLLPRSLPLCEPLSVIPAHHEVVAPGIRSFLSEAEYELLLLLAEAPRTWRSLGAVNELFHWRLCETAAAARLKDLARRLRKKLGSYGSWLIFDCHRGVCLREPQ